VSACLMSVLNPKIMRCSSPGPNGFRSSVKKH
jgi:hypothetical protein